MTRITISRENVERLQRYAEKKHPGLKVRIGSHSPKIGANDVISELFEDQDRLIEMIQEMKRSQDRLVEMIQELKRREEME